MKKTSAVILIFSFLFLMPFLIEAQCSMCTKTAAQLGEKPALGLNNGILYLMLAPFAVIGIIGYKWWKSEKSNK